VLLFQFPEGDRIDANIRQQVGPSVASRTPCLIMMDIIL
jgi:hypothetical protein